MTYPHCSQVLLSLSLGFISGVALGLLGSLIGFAIFCFFLGLIFIYPLSALRFLSIFVLVGGVSGFLYSDNVMYDHDQYIRGGESFSGRVVVVADPKRTDYALNVTVDSTKEAHELRVLAGVPKYEELVLGDEFLLSCELEAPEVFDGFNYPMYLRMRGVDYICKNATVSDISAGEGFLVRLSALRRELEVGVDQLIRSPEAGLANGLLFGGDDRLSQDLQDAFSRTGMSHIVAVSGYNVSVIIMVLTVVGIRLGLWRKQAAILSLFAIVLFVAMIGFPSSGVRAAIMGALVLGAMMYGRVTHAFGVVVFACALMLAWNPLQLFWDVGFQLSFAAVLGIMSFFPLFERYAIAKNRSPFFLEILFMTISAQLFVLPIIIYHFHAISSVSLVTNLLVLPILPFTMFFVFVTAIFAQISFLLALPFAWISQFLLTYEIVVIEYFASKSWSVIDVVSFSWLWASVYCGVLLLLVWYFVWKGAYEK